MRTIKRDTAYNALTPTDPAQALLNAEAEEKRYSAYDPAQEGINALRAEKVPLYPVVILDGSAYRLGKDADNLRYLEVAAINLDGRIDPESWAELTEPSRDAERIYDALLALEGFDL